MTIKIEAAQRLFTAAPNKLKNEVMRTLTSRGFHATRTGNDRFFVDATLDELVTALEAKGWKYTRSYREFTKTGEDYSIAATPDGSCIALDFLYSA